MPLYDAKHYPERFIELKKNIIGDEVTLTKAWADLLAALKDATAEYASKGPSMIPIIEFDQLETLGKPAFPLPLPMGGSPDLSRRRCPAGSSRADLVDTFRGTPS